MGSLPVLTQHVINHTKRIKVGPIGYVLPGWNPMRLALEIAWLDQLTKGRTFVGFARGYQTRWLNQMAQKIHVGATVSDKSETTASIAKRSKRFSASQARVGRRTVHLQGKYYDTRIRRKERPGLRTSGRASSAPGRSRRTRADPEDQRGAEALPAAASASVSGLFD